MTRGAASAAATTSSWKHRKQSNPPGRAAVGQPGDAPEPDQPSRDSAGDLVREEATIEGIEPPADEADDAVPTADAPAPEVVNPAGERPASMDEAEAEGPTAEADETPTTTMQPGFPAESSCLADIATFDRDGPFDYEETTSGEVKLRIPDLPDGCRVPVIHLANGTSAYCSVYGSILDRYASHGFITACYEDTNTGAGTQGFEALTTVFEEYPDLAAMRIGSVGHSQGGQAAFIVLERAESKWGADAVYAGLAMQPASGYGDQPSEDSWEAFYSRIQSPMFMFSGTLDILVSRTWVSTAYAALDNDVEAYHWSAVGSTHIPTPNDETAEVGVPWFRWKLLNDTAACEAFKALRNDSSRAVVQEQNEAPCE